ncbi:hypothetical protein D3C71_1632710 [compost metagenome]
MQQGAGPVVFDAPVDFFGRGAQVQHVAKLAQGFSIFGAQHGAAAGGQDHATSLPGHVGQGLRLQVAKAGFALGLEEAADGGADGLFQPVVQVDEGHPRPVGQLAADGGFAGAGHADQCAADLHRFKKEVWETGMRAAGGAASRAVIGR